jgi:hypothetical protein
MCVLHSSITFSFLHWQPIKKTKAARKEKVGVEGERSIAHVTFLSTLAVDSSPPERPVKETMYLTAFRLQHQKQVVVTKLFLVGTQVPVAGKGCPLLFYTSNILFLFSLLVRK